ncbi:MAG: hypothetical protein J5752_00110 [Clostridiales bacterium]|nr:hypothetical protein [Clostridiales bacterium]
MNRKENIKKRSYILLTLAVLIGISACSSRQKTTTDDSSFFESESSSQTEYSTTLEESISTTTTEVYESSAFEIIIDETVPHENPVIEKVEDVYIFAAPEVGFGLGLGNPVIADNAIDKYVTLSGKNDSWLQESAKTTILDHMDYLIPTENAYDRVGYYEIWKNTQDSFFEDSRRGIYAFDIDLIRYIMSRNNLRFWIDELPYSLFESMFPNFIELYSERAIQIKAGFISPEDCNFECIVCPETPFMYFVSNLHGSFKNADNSYIDEIAETELRGLIYRQMSTYNTQRMVYLLASRVYSCGQIDLGRTEDGKYVAVPTKEQYEKMMSDFHSIPGCETMDILKVETRDDLIAAGIDVDRYDKLFNKIQ